jgi:hypothetical protein
MSVRIVRVIFCDELRRGKGTEDDMVRRIPSLYTLDGDLICEFDYGPTEGSQKATVNNLIISSLGNQP